MNVGIIGLGLIGGSMAKSVKARTAHTVWGLDTDAETMTLARICGAIDGTLTDENLPQCDLILAAVRPGAAIEWVEAHGSNIAKSAILVDLCGVKRVVVGKIAPIAEKYGFAYIGGHPMAGRENGGYANASPQMFDGASMILVPHTEIPESINAYLRALGFANRKISTDETHDRMIAFTSQMAHVVSNNYCKSEVGVDHHGYSADSLRDLTRVAGLNAQMWSELFIGNKDFLLLELDRLMQDIGRMRDAIEQEKTEELEQMLEEGSAAKYRLFPRGVACDEYPS